MSGFVFLLIVLLACCARALDIKRKTNPDIKYIVTAGGDDSGSKLRDKEQQRLSSK